jgi:hypothetical protein
MCYMAVSARPEAVTVARFFQLTGAGLEQAAEPHDTRAVARTGLTRFTSLVGRGATFGIGGDSNQYARKDQANRRGYDAHAEETTQRIHVD